MVSVVLIMITMTKIVHCNKEPYDVYIGRPSIWGNPFREGVDGTRSEVIDKFKCWILNNDELLNLLPTLEGKILGCWCKPRACHGDILVELINRKIWCYWK